MNSLNPEYISGRKYFGADDADAAILALSDKWYGGKFNGLISNIRKKHESWEECLDFAVCYIGEGCGVSG